jgi:hypothetical protein
MRILVFIIIIIFCSFVPVIAHDGSAKAASEQREKLVLLPFSLHGVTVEEGEQLARRFAEVMRESGRFDVSLADSGMGISGTSKTLMVAGAGNVLGAQKVVQIDVVRRKKLTTLRIRLVNVSDKALLYAERVDHQGDWSSLLSSVIPEQARKLCSAHLDAKTPWGKAAFLFGASLAAIIWIFWLFRRKDAGSRKGAST